jgi:hypothetical protein
MSRQIFLNAYQVIAKVSLFDYTTIVIIKKHVIHHEVHEGHEVHKNQTGLMAQVSLNIVFVNFVIFVVKN